MKILGTANSKDCFHGFTRQRGEQFRLPNWTNPVEQSESTEFVPSAL
jgi:hypothetical protein